jgi:hypothetical protein
MLRRAIRALDRAAEDDGAFCSTFFKGLACHRATPRESEQSPITVSGLEMQ